jgi:hypothetical protein
LQKQGNIGEAEQSLRSAIVANEFARCELTTSLAIVLYTSGDKDNAVKELEGVQPLVDLNSSPECLRSQYLLGLLYKDLGDQARSGASWQAFMANSIGTTDPELLKLRQSVEAD